MRWPVVIVRATTAGRSTRSSSTIFCVRWNNTIA
jgi:hypothetical protein